MDINKDLFKIGGKTKDGSPIYVPGYKTNLYWVRMGVIPQIVKTETPICLENWDGLGYRDRMFLTEEEAKDFIRNKGYFLTRYGDWVELDNINVKELTNDELRLFIKQVLHTLRDYFNRHDYFINILNISEQALNLLENSDENITKNTRDYIYNI